MTEISNSSNANQHYPAPSRHPIAVMLRNIERATDATRGVMIEPFERDYLFARIDELRVAVAVCSRPEPREG
jgi:hypothetical protein